MKLWPFRVLDSTYGNLIVVAIYVLRFRAPGTPLEADIGRLLPVLALANAALIVRLWRLSTKPEPPASSDFPWAKLLKGNAFAVLVLILLYTPRNPGYMLFLAAAILGVGNLAFVYEWHWRKSRLLRSGPSK